MRRVLPLLLLVLVVGAVVFRNFGAPDPDPHGLASEAVLTMEQRIAERELGAARQGLSRHRGLSDVAKDYLLSAIALAERDNERALELARRAGRAAPGEWRPFSVEYSALLALDRGVEAGALARRAAELITDDERVLAVAALDYAVSATDPDPTKALQLLDAIDALPERQAAAGDPTAVLDEQLLGIRVTAFTLAERFGSALEAARELSRLQPDDPTIAINLGEAARRAGDLPTAIAAFRRAVKAVPTALAWRQAFVQLLLEEPDSLEAALEESEILVTIAPASREARVLRARALVRSEKVRSDGPDESVAIYRGLLASDPTDTEVLRNLAVLLYDWKVGGQDGDYLNESHSLLRRYVRAGGEIDEKLEPIWTILQERARRRGSEDPTAPAREAFERTPGDARAATDLIEALAADGRQDEIGGVVRRLAAESPDDPAVCVLAATHFVEQGPDHDAELALGYLGTAAKELGGLDALPEPLLWLRCRALLLSGRYEEALKVATQLVEQRPGTAPYLAARGAAAFRTERMAVAESAFRAALDADPTPSRRVDLARVLVETEDGPAEAAHQIERVIDGGGRTLEAVRIYGRALLRIEGRREEGMQILMQIVATQPEDLAALGALAAAQLEDGRRDVAQRAIELYRSRGGLPQGPAELVWRELLGDDDE